MDISPRYNTVVLITDSYPLRCDTEGAFISPEMECLSRMFRRVIVMPVNRVAAGATVGGLPGNVEVSLWWISHADCRSVLRRIRYLFHPDLWKALRGDLSRSSVTFSVAAKAFSSVLPRWMKEQGLDWDTTLFYTFWFDMAACGLGIAARKYPLHFVSRAHGYDIRGVRGKFLRRQAIERLAMLFPASCSGRDVFCGRYPDMASKVRPRILGCAKLYPGVLSGCHLKADKRFTFLSVARVSPEKRVCMIHDFIRALAVARPDTCMEWIHVGDGPEMDLLKSRIEASSIGNMRVTLTGAIDNESVHRIYMERPVDWSILLSNAEGGHPVAACESFAYGVPVVATQVGGLAEMVDDDCGLLLSHDPTVEEFVRGIAPYLDSDCRTASLRSGAYEKWRTCYDASSLRTSFVNEISTL